MFLPALSGRAQAGERAKIICHCSRFHPVSGRTKNVPFIFFPSGTFCQIDDCLPGSSYGWDRRRPSIRPGRCAMHRRTARAGGPHSKATVVHGTLWTEARTLQMHRGPSGSAGLVDQAGVKVDRRSPPMKKKCEQVNGREADAHRIIGLS